MKVLFINGSPKANGNTAIALNEMIKVFNAEGVETELIHVGNKDIRGCIACGKCFETGKCIFDDVVNEVAHKFEACDGIVVGSLFQKDQEKDQGRQHKHRRHKIP